jgi:hypothetical protein
MRGRHRKRGIVKVAIVASGHGRYKAPVGDPAWECWGVNSTYAWFNHEVLMRGFSRWFELHRRAFLLWENEADRYGDHFNFITRNTNRPPLYVQDVEEWPGVEGLREFPFEKVQALLPEFGYYHACSIDWLIAYAITEGATEIGLYGVEQDHTVEPIGSRACVEFWLGFAAARGVKISSADGSTFKLAHLVRTRTPYAIDPQWLPFEDRTSGLDSTLGKARADLGKRLAEEAKYRDE